MMFIVYYNFFDSRAQKKGAQRVTRLNDKGGPQNRLIGHNFKSWTFLLQHGNGHSLVDADFLETIGRQWLPWRELKGLLLNLVRI